MGAARWLIDRLDTQDTANLLGIVRTFDKALNNTSVVLLVSIGAKRLLLAGDAQLENWSYTLKLINQEKYFRPATRPRRARSLQGWTPRQPERHAQGPIQPLGQRATDNQERDPP